MSSSPTEDNVIPEYERTCNFEDNYSESNGTELKRGKFLQKKRSKNKKMPLGLRILLIVLTVLFILALAAAITLQCLWLSGQKKLLPNYSELAPSIPNAAVIDESEAEKMIQDDSVDNAQGDNRETAIYIVKNKNGEADGHTIIYNGKKYVLNDKIASILFMGVDDDFSKNADNDTPGKGGQADAILLMTIDTETGKTTVLCFPRDSYAEVDYYSADNKYIGTKNTQLCLAYAYGDGKESSCENTMKSVERFIYGIPIQSYTALDIEGVLIANDSIGGVTLNSICDMTFYDGSSVKEGESVTLLGKKAEAYIRSRSWEDLDANVARMSRQKQYVQNFASTVTAQAKNDLTVITRLFNILNDYMVTDLQADGVTYLASIYLQHGADFRFRTVQTASIEKVDGHAMYYLDENDLKNCVVDLFYKPAE